MTPPPQPPALLFFMVACSLSASLAMAETLAAFKEHDHCPLRHIACHPLALLLTGFYAFMTLCVGLLFWEADVLRFSWTWAIGLGLGVPWAAQTGITLFKPISGSNNELVASLKDFTDRFREFCYLRIKRSLEEQRLHHEHSYMQQSGLDVETLIARVESTLSGEELATVKNIIVEKQTHSPDRLQAFLISVLSQRDPSFTPQVTSLGAVHEGA